MEAAHNEVIDSLADMFQDDSTNLIMILEIVWMNHNMALVVTEENSGVNTLDQAMGHNADEAEAGTTSGGVSLCREGAQVQAAVDRALV